MLSVDVPDVSIVVLLSSVSIWGDDDTDNPTRPVKTIESGYCYCDLAFVIDGPVSCPMTNSRSFR